jgi:HEAT repeat protein
MTDKVGNAKLAQKIIIANSDLDGLRPGECADAGIDKSRCEYLIGALAKTGERSDLDPRFHDETHDGSWAISKAERERLSKLGFSGEFISKLAGPDGMRALRVRAKWLRKALRDESTEVREGAAHALGFADHAAARKAVPGLMRALEDNAGNVAVKAAIALGRLGPAAKASVPTLIAVTETVHEGCLLYLVASEALEKIKPGKPDVPSPVAELEDGDSRPQAGETLIHIGAEAKKAIPTLVAMLNDEEKRVRRGAEGALSRIGSASVPSLIGALKDPDKYMRAYAARTLGRIGPAASKAIPALIAALDDDDELVKGFAAEALGDFGAEAKDAVPALKEAFLSSGQWVKREIELALSEIEGSE